MNNMRLRSRGLPRSSQERSSSDSSSRVAGAGAPRRSGRLESCPTSSQVQSRREREDQRGCPPAPHNSVDQSVIVLDDTLQENTLEEVFGSPAPAREGRGGRGRGRPIPVFLEDPESEATARSRLLEYSEEDLAAHQNAINRALGLIEETGSPPDSPEQEELIEIEDTTEEESELLTTTSSPEPSSPAGLQEVSFTLEAELTIDLTDSPPVSPPASLGLGQPSNPASPAMQCPVCLDTFSAIRSRGSQLVSTVCGHVFCRSCLRQCVLTQEQCPTCRRRIAHKDYHPLFL